MKTIPKPTLDHSGQTEIGIIDKVHSKLKVLRNGNADIGVFIVSVCEWSGFKIYDVIVVKINLTLISITGNGDKLLYIRPGTNRWPAIVMVKRNRLLWYRNLIAYIRVRADERKPHARKALDDAKELLGGQNCNYIRDSASSHNNSPFLVHFQKASTVTVLPSLVLISYSMVRISGNIWPFLVDLYKQLHTVVQVMRL